MAKKRKSCPVSPAKARKILRDGSIRGKPLTKKQRGLFGMCAGKSKKKKKKR